MLRRQLARELRRLREEAKVPGEQLAHRLRCSPSRISRIETAQVRIAPGTVHEILDALEVKVDAASRERLVSLAREAEHSAWWQRYDQLPRAVTTYYALESEAASLRSFEPTVVHGLLQSDEYVRALTRHWHEGDLVYVESMVASRRHRRAVLTKTPPLNLHVVLDEAALHRQVGGASVLAEQLGWLVRYAELPNIRIQVVPFDAGIHSGPSGPFNILGFQDVSEPAVVYIESAWDQMLLERKTEAYEETFDRLCQEALDEAESLALILTKRSQLVT
jgi:transcriptional regulator with XRE-family HTH domain